MEITGKAALITGGASGIGKTTARMLAAKGASLMLVDLNSQLGDEAVKQIEGEGGRAAFIPADVRDEAQMKRAFEQTVARFGRLDIVYNNAGIATPQPGFTRIAIDAKQVLDIDLFGVVLGCYLAFPLMREHGGVIVNTASMAGVYPIAGDPVYAAAKAGVVHLTHSLAYWARHGVRINCVCPGIVDTPLARQQARDEKKAGRAPARPTQALMKPEVIAEVVIKFIEDDSQAGQVVEVRPTGPRVVAPRRAPGQSA